MKLKTFLIATALSFVATLVHPMEIPKQPQKEYQIGIIPGLEIPVKVSYRDWSSFGPIKSIILAGSTLLHGTWACASTANNLKTRAAHHALLCAASHGVGGLQTFSHELGHAVVDRAQGARDVEIGIWGDHSTVLTGIYGGSYKGIRQAPSLPTYDDEGQTVAIKEDLLEYIDLYDKYQCDNIKMLVAGPVSGTLTGYGIFKLAQSKYPSLFQNRWFKGICLAGVLGQTINFAPLHPDMDGPRAHQAWQDRSKVLKIKEEIQGLPEKARIPISIEK